jgi:geranylgeranyl pyrophosphate synthase
VPPLTLDELRTHAEQIVEAAGGEAAYLDFATVMVGNETWRETIAGIPYERRVLLLPQCIRTRSKCPAEVDDVGLLCEACGSCAIGKFQTTAESLDCVTLVAEGTTVVTRLLEQGRVDAVIGVSCLEVLERAFPHTAAHAIPGIAIPLYRAGCDNTAFDEDWLESALKLRGAEQWAGRVDIDKLRAEVDSWFQPAPLAELIGSSDQFTERESLAWLAANGKRWRPLLTACVYQALSGSSEKENIPDNVRKVAVATECFHKASLLHDDIEDGDDFRYGQPTPARRFGMPIALNLGDHLIGEGYRLLAQSGLPAAQQARMLAAAAEGHRSLCLGQGAELRMLHENSKLSTAQVLDIFRQKTAPAFEVALRLGAICANADEAVEQSLRRFSEALGVAFQIRDDLEDLEDSASDGNTRASILRSLAWEHASEHGASAESSLQASERAQEKARQLLDHYRSEAIRSLSGLQNSQLKGLLRRLVGRVIGPGLAKPTV